MSEGRVTAGLAGVLMKKAFEEGIRKADLRERLQALLGESLYFDDMIFLRDRCAWILRLQNT